MRPFQFEKVKDIKEALSKKNFQTQFIAGGTNLVDLMKKNVIVPEKLVGLNSALSNSIEETKNGIFIGAMVKNTEVADHEGVVKNYPLLSKAILAGASQQIRNMASVSGNLLQRTRCPYFYDVTTPCNKREKGSGCSAYEGENKMSAIIGYNEECVAVFPSDMCVALSALEAKVLFETKEGKKESIAFQDFHKLPENTPWLDNKLPENAIITEVEIPKNDFSEHFSYLKLRERTSYAFALISVAAALSIKGDKIKEARLASGGVAHKPWRWKNAEEYLKGKAPLETVFKAAAEIVIKDIKPLSHNGFKVPMLKGAIETALENCLKA